MPNKPVLKLQIGDSAEVQLLEDKPIPGTNENGEYNMYKVRHDGVEKVHFASAFAHERLIHFKSGDVVNIEHKPLSNGRSVYDVVLIKESSLGDKPVNSDTDQAIKWGMAFNNATRLVANISDITPKQKITLIEEIMPEMFKIACSMPIPIEPNTESDDDSDDLPF